jgi:hypothetical protein
MLKRGKKSKKDESVQILTETIKSILSYMDDITNRIKEFEVEIKTLNLRLDHIERNIAHTSTAPTAPAELPPLPQFPTSRTSQPPSGIPTLQGPPRDVKSELDSVLKGGRKLKSIEQGKHDQFMELRSAVHEEYKSTRKKPKQSSKAPISPVTSVPESQNDSETRDQLKNDLDESLKKMQKKMRR